MTDPTAPTDRPAALLGGVDVCTLPLTTAVDVWVPLPLLA